MKEKLLAVGSGIVLAVTASGMWEGSPTFVALMFIVILVALTTMGIKESASLDAIDVYRIPGPEPYSARFPPLPIFLAFATPAVGTVLLSDSPALKLALYLPVFIYVSLEYVSREERVNRWHTLQTRERLSKALADPNVAAIAAAEEPLISTLLRANAMDGTRVRVDYLAKELGTSEDAVLASAQNLKQAGLVRITHVSSFYVELQAPGA